MKDIHVALVCVVGFFSVVIIGFICISIYEVNADKLELAYLERGCTKIEGEWECQTQK